METQNTLSPIDRRIAANDLARRNPAPDPHIRREQELRKVDDAPLDLRSLSAWADADRTVASKRASVALETAHHSWTKIKEAASDAVKKADTAIRTGMKESIV